MKIIREQTEDFSIEVLQEADGSGKRKYFLSGVHMQSEKVNKNGRMYPRGVLENEVNRYRSLIESKRSIGELGHPDTPSVDYKQASHLITDLHFEGNDVFGKSKVMDTPNGRIVMTLIDEGVQIGMSSRALGSLKQQNGVNIVQEDLKLATIDIVHEPSAPDAFVNAIFEGKEWLFINGLWTEQRMEYAKKELTRADRKDIDTIGLKIFEGFLNSLKV